MSASKAIPLERLQQRTAEQILHVPVSQIRGEIVEVTQIVPQGRIADRVVEQIVDTSVCKIREQIVGVMKVIFQELLRQHTEELNMNRFFPRERFSDRNAKQTVDVSTQTQERCVEDVKTIRNSALGSTR